MLKKNEKLLEVVVGDKISDKDRQSFALYLTEIYFRSKHIVELIEKISKTDLYCAESDLDSLLGNLIELRLEIYV